MSTQRDSRHRSTKSSYKCPKTVVVLLVCDGVARHKYFQKVWLGTLTTLGSRISPLIIAAITYRTGCFTVALIVDTSVALYFWECVWLRSVLMCMASSESGSLLRIHGHSDA